MTNTDTSEKIHQGKNVRRFREMLEMKQEALASELGGDWTQRKVSLLEQKESIEPEILEQVAKVLKVTPDAIKNFSEEVAINFVNNFNDNSVNHGPLNNHYCTFNPLDKYVEAIEENKKLYTALLKEKDEKITLLEKMLGEKKK